MAILSPNREMPVYFQRTDAGYVYRALRAGESCSLVGIGSVGKSNLLRHLIRPEVKKLHLRGEASMLVTVLLDPHNMLHLENDALQKTGRSWPGYELILSRLHRALWMKDEQEKQTRGGVTSGEISPEIFNRLRDLRNRLWATDSVMAQSGLRHLEKSVHTILTAQPNWKIAFMFDDIEAFQDLPSIFFQSLRGLRDDFKGMVMYLTTSRQELDKLLIKGTTGKKKQRMESFVELFNDHTYFIHPLDEPSTAAMIQSMIERNNYHEVYEQYFNDPQQLNYFNQTLYSITGGHGGLLRRCFKPMVLHLTNQLHTAAMDYLVADRGVVKECNILIDSLSLEERTTLYHWITGTEALSAFDPAWQPLIAKHIIEIKNGTLWFRLPILGQYIQLRPQVLLPEQN